MKYYIKSFFPILILVQIGFYSGFIIVHATIAPWSTYATDDSYVISCDGDEIKGYMDYMEVGFSYSSCCNEVYLQFDISNKPELFTKVELSLCSNFAIGSLDPVPLDIYYITETWSENTLNWTNRPSGGELITQITLDDVGYITIEITNTINANSENDIFTIALRPTNSSNSMKYQIISTEYENYVKQRPLVTFTYDVADDPGTYVQIQMVIAVILIIGVPIAAIIITRLILKRRIY